MSYESYFDAKIRKVGNSIGIIFDVDDKRIHDLKIGRVINIEIIEVRDLKKKKYKIKKVVNMLDIGLA